MRNKIAIIALLFCASTAYCQQDSLILRLYTVKVDKQMMSYVVKLEFISNKKSEISFQYEPRYVMPNKLDGVGLEFEHLEENCYKSLIYSDVHPIPGFDILKGNIKNMSHGDTVTITREIGSNIKTFVGLIKDTPNFIFKGQHRIRAYRVYIDDKGYKTKFSNWFYINFDELK